jgi:hypothetical protein
VGGDGVGVVVIGRDELGGFLWLVAVVGVVVYIGMGKKGASP